MLIEIYIYIYIYIYMYIYIYIHEVRNKSFCFFLACFFRFLSVAIPVFPFVRNFLKTMRIPMSAKRFWVGGMRKDRPSDTLGELCYLCLAKQGPFKNIETPPCIMRPVFLKRWHSQLTPTMLLCCLEAPP
jgi:hypothetical protein